jgi:hypothetical protein
VRRTTAIATTLGLVGGAWGLAAGTDAGVAGVPPAALALIGAVVALRRPGGAFVMLVVAGSVGVLVAGSAWIGPGLVVSAAGLLLLAGLPDPFAGERARERGEVP